MRKMGLKGPGSNSGLRTENPDILIAEMKQIMRGGCEEEEDKRDQKKLMGPLKPANEMSATLCHCTISVMCLCSCVALLALSILDFTWWVQIQLLALASSSLWYKVFIFIYFCFYLGFNSTLSFFPLLGSLRHGCPFFFQTHIRFVPLNLWL